VEGTSTALVQARTDFGTFGDTVPVEGELVLHAPGCRGPEQGCADAAMTSISLRSSESFEIGPVSISDIDAFNLTALPGSVLPMNARQSVLVLDAGGEALSQGTRDGSTQIGAMQLASPVSGTIDWVSRTVTFDAVFSGGDVDMLLHIDGRLPSLPPVADAGEDQTSECGLGPISLSASGSMDPDGLDDIVSYVWSRETAHGVVGVADTRDTAIELPRGTHSLAVAVRDRRSHMDVDGLAVDVQDTLAPNIDATLATDCLWPPNHELALFRLGQEIRAEARDTCEGPTSVRIVDVVSSESEDAAGDGSTEPDVVFGSGALCVRAERAASGPGRTYTVVLESVDGAGNVARRQVEIRVPHDQHSGRTCTTGDLVARVDGGDPRCTTPATGLLVPATAAAASQSAPGAGPAGTVSCSVQQGRRLPASRFGWVVVSVLLLLGARPRR
jgi:hypothetical protein